MRVLAATGEAPAAGPGRTMGVKRIAVVGSIIWLACASPASACPVCVVAALDLVIPPVMLWSALSLTWFLSLAILSSIAKHHLEGQPSILLALAIGGLAVIAAGSFLGPIAILPLALPPVYASVRALRWRPDSTRLARVRKLVLLTGLAHSVAAVVGLGLLVHTLLTRTDGQYICQWSGTAPGRGRFKALREHEPESLESYRYIVERCSGWVVADAVERLGSIGDPVQDTDRLRRARSAAGGEPDLTAVIENALAALEKRHKPGT